MNRRATTDPVSRFRLRWYAMNSTVRYAHTATPSTVIKTSLNDLDVLVSLSMLLRRFECKYICRLVFVMNFVSIRLVVALFMSDRYMLMKNDKLQRVMENDEVKIC